MDFWNRTNENALDKGWNLPLFILMFFFLLLVLIEAYETIKLSLQNYNTTKVIALKVITILEL